MQTTFIYGLECPLTKEIKYVGKSNNPKNRIKQHLYEFRTNRKVNQYKDKLKPLLVILDEVPIDEWGYWESWWLEVCRGWGFGMVNLLQGGDGCSKHHPETIEKISKSQSGKNNAMHGKKHSDETKKKFLLRKLTEEQKKKISQSRKGIATHSKLTKEDVIKIKSLLNEGLSPYKIAKQYKVNHQTIYNIKNGKTWVNLLND